MYQIICLQNEKEQTRVKYAFLIVTIVSLIIACLCLIDYQQTVCSSSDYNLPGLLYMTLGIILPELITLIGIIFFYLRIKQSLQVQINLCPVLLNSNKIFFKRIYGYSAVYLIIIIGNMIFFIQFFFSPYDAFTEIVRVIIYAYYPFFDSLIYGMTKSSKDVLKFNFNRNQDYRTKTELLHDMRMAYMILPRTFYDIIDMSEDAVLE